MNENIEHYFVVKWTAEDGFTFDGEVESEVFPDGTMWDTTTKSWQPLPARTNNPELRERDLKLVGILQDYFIMRGNTL